MAGFWGTCWSGISLGCRLGDMCCYSPKALFEAFIWVGSYEVCLEGMKAPKHGPMRLLPAELLWLPQLGTEWPLARAWGEQHPSWAVTLTRFTPSALGSHRHFCHWALFPEVATHVLGVSIAWSGGERSMLQSLGSKQDPGFPVVGSEESIW